MSRGRQRLGRGLGALLGDDFLGAPPEHGDVRTLRVSRIAANPFQPRREFGEEDLRDLKASIQDNGLLQPLVVRPTPGDERQRYQLVAGERRLRSVIALGWTQVSAVVREVDDRQLLVLALVENLQREALNPLEEAEGYRVLSEEFSLTQAEIAKAVGKQRSSVANALRLLGLPPSVRRMLEQGDLSMGHGRALLAVEDPVRQGELARAAFRQGWSVRETEARVRRDDERGTRGRGERAAPRRSGDPVVQSLEEELRKTLGTRVLLRAGKRGTGTIEIPFRSSEDFERLFHLITGREASDVAG